jgi:hypothetical protein
VYLIGSHDLVHPEHGYARLRETIVVLQMAPPNSGPGLTRFCALVNML